MNLFTFTQKIKLEMLKVSFVNLCRVTIAPDFFYFFFYCSLLNKHLKIFIAFHGMQAGFQVRNQSWKRKDATVMSMSFVFPV